jgi:hypothetical protein
VAALLQALFIAVVAAIVFVKRRELARAHAAILGGRIPPGCIIAEAIVLLLIALVIAIVRID